MYSWARWRSPARAQHRSNRRVRRAVASGTDPRGGCSAGHYRAGSPQSPADAGTAPGRGALSQEPGPRRSAVLTDQGRRFLPHAIGFLERAQELCRTFDVEAGPREIRVASSQYLIRYLLIDILKEFRKAAPEIHVRISTMNELEVEESTTERSRGVDGRCRPVRTVTRPRLSRAVCDELEPDYAAEASARHQAPRAPAGSRRSAAHHLRTWLDRPTARARCVSRKRRSRRTWRWKRPAPKRLSAWSKRGSALRSCRFCRAAPSHVAGASRLAGSTRRFGRFTPVFL